MKGGKVDPSEEVRTKKLTIVDNDGRERLSINAGWPDGTTTIMFMGRQAGGLYISIDEADKVQVSLRSASNHDTAIIGLSDSGEPWIRFNDKSGKPVVLVGRFDDDIFKAMIVDQDRIVWVAPQPK